LRKEGQRKHLESTGVKDNRFRAIRFFFAAMLQKVFTLGFLLSSLVFSSSVSSQSLESRYTSVPIKVDGILDDHWLQADSAYDFQQYFPFDSSLAEAQTVAKILYDDDFTYVLGIMYNKPGPRSYVTPSLRRDFRGEANDSFTVIFDPFKDHTNGILFGINPFGVRREGLIVNGGSGNGAFSLDWDNKWVGQAKQYDGYWLAEMAIPFKTLRFAEGQDSWYLNFYRVDSEYAERSTWSPIQRNFSIINMATHRTLYWDKPTKKPGANISIIPFVAANRDRDFQEEGNDSDGFDAGVDLKYAVTPGLNLDVTINPDFSQVEVDQQVTNLDRFEIFFPERRQFFLENSGIWSGGLQQSIRPFFSRRIGLQGSFDASPAPIDAGARFTQRTDKQAIAALAVRQRETNTSQAANFGVIRYLRNYGRENNIGIMVTQRSDEASSELDTAANSNTTISIDGQIRPTSEWDIQYLASSSIDEASGKTGYAGRIFAGKSTNKYYFGWVTEYTDENYDPKMGFIRQSNLIRHNPGGYYIWRPKTDFIRRWDPGMFVNYNHDADEPSNFQQANLYIFPVYTWFRDNSFLEISITPTWQNINFDFAPLGLEIAQDEYYYTRYLIRYNTDRSKKWSVDARYNFGDFYNGNRNTVQLSGRLAPIPHIAFTVDYEYNNLKRVGENKENLDAELVTLGARFALNPRVQLSAFYQNNSLDDQGRWNVRASWEYMPLSFVYLVFNDTQIDGFEDPFQEQQFIGKITFLRQF